MQRGGSHVHGHREFQGRRQLHEWEHRAPHSGCGRSHPHVAAHLEEKTGGTKINLSHVSMPCMAKHETAKITRYQIRDAARTSYQSFKGY